MKFIELWSEFTPKYVSNISLYNLNDPSGVHISEAGASVISDIILDYVKLPVEGDYTQNIFFKNVSEVQHQPQVQRVNNNQKFPNHLEAIVPLK